MDVVMIFGSPEENSFSHMIEILKKLKSVNKNIKILVSGAVGLNDGAAKHFGVVREVVHQGADGKALAPAEYLKKIMEAANITVDFIEPHSINTGENIIFSRALLEAHGIHPKKALVLQNPYGQKRVGPTFFQQWRLLSCWD